MSKKKWIQGAIKRPGALTRKAKAKGMTVPQYCAAVKSGKIKVSTQTKRQCALAKTLKKMSKKKKKGR